MSRRFTTLTMVCLSLALVLVGLDFVTTNQIAFMNVAQQITPANSLTVLPPTSTITLTPSVTPTSTPSPTSTPTLTPFPDDHEIFVYVSDRSGYREIYLHDLDTGRERQLTANFGLAMDAPSLSPDRAWVVYEELLHESFLVMTNMSANYRRALSLEVIDFLEYSQWGPAWSPDGTQLALHSDQYGNSDIFIMNPETYELRQVTTNSEADAYAAWSPDGTQLVYQCTINEGREICVIDVTGNNLVQLTDNDRFDGMPDWSPDGTQIVYAASRDEEKEELYIMNVDGSNVQRLTNLPDSVETDPKWSPDGEYILFESDAGRDFEICMIRADGGNLECLTDNHVDDRSADW